ncbi:MAG: sulfite exporter TauE/SafE family protein [Syntrophaceae bacterium]
MDTVFFIAFAAGFLGGFGHCAGMCGPLVAAYAMPLKPNLLYSAGRITTYAFVGSLMGLTGSFVNTVGQLGGLQDLVAALAGILMIGAGLQWAGILSLPALPVAFPDPGLLRAARAVMERESIWKYYPLGVLLGFLPCGLSYTVFISAAGTGGLLSGMATMLSFGIGTLPAMLLVGSLASFAKEKAGARLRTAGGIAIILMGVLFLVRGIHHYAHV